MKRKYVVIRMDGSVPRWPFFVLGGADAAAPAALRAYANECDRLGMSSHYTHDVRALAQRFEDYQAAYGAGEPDAPSDRKTCEFAYLVAKTNDVAAERLELPA